MKTLTDAEKNEMLDLMAKLDELRTGQYDLDESYAMGEKTRPEWTQNKLAYDREMRKVYARMHQLRG